MIRFSGQVAAARIAVPFEGVATKFAHSPRNFIDEEIDAELTRLRIPPSPGSDDAQFIRRAYLDLVGRLPSSEQAREWIASRRTPEDREKLIEALLKTDDFVDFWTLKFADLLLISGKAGSESAALAYHNWLRSQIATNAPWDAIAHSLIGSVGDVTHNGPANFLTLASDPRDLAEYASDILLSTQIACARCHAHPADRWTRDD